MSTWDVVVGLAQAGPAAWLGLGLVFTAGAAIGYLIRRHDHD